MKQPLPQEKSPVYKSVIRLMAAPMPAANVAMAAWTRALRQG